MTKTPIVGDFQQAKRYNIHGDRKTSFTVIHWRRKMLWIVISFNTLRPRQNGRHFPDDIFKWIFLNENVWISINISLNFVPNGPINNNPILVQIMAWCRPGDKPLFEPMMVSLLTHIYVTRPQWVKPKLEVLSRAKITTHILWPKTSFVLIWQAYRVPVKLFN